MYEPEKLRFKYTVCTVCNDVEYANRNLHEVAPREDCSKCGKKGGGHIMCWWAAHPNKEESYYYTYPAAATNAVLKKCESCENRFICFTSTPLELNALST